MKAVTAMGISHSPASVSRINEITSDFAMASCSSSSENKAKTPQSGSSAANTGDGECYFNVVSMTEQTKDVFEEMEVIGRQYRLCINSTHLPFHDYLSWVIVKMWRSSRLSLISSIFREKTKKEIFVGNFSIINKKNKLLVGDFPEGNKRKKFLHKEKK